MIIFRLIIFFFAELAVKIPSVFIVYSTDCEPHIKAVTAFACYLRDVWKCDVQFDLWDSDQIQERGLYNWVNEQIEQASHVVFICSTGARFQCSKSKRVRLKEIRILPDSFTLAVDIVAEKMRIYKASGECLSRFVSLYFDYSSESDIPTKLDLTLKYSMMSDIFELYQHVYQLKTQTGKISSKLNGMRAEKYRDTEKGKALNKAIKDVKKYFQENPGWLDSRIEPFDNDATNSESSLAKNGKKSPRKSPSSSHTKEKEPLPPAKVNIEDETDTVRRQRREQYLQNGTNPRASSFIKSKSKHIPSNHSSGSSTTPLLPVQNTERNGKSPTKENITDSSNPDSPESPGTPNKTIQKSESNKSLKDLEEVSISPEEELNQMQKDIEFINSAGNSNSHFLTDPAMTTHWLLDSNQDEFQEKLSYMNPLYDTLYESPSADVSDIFALINQSDSLQENGQVVTIRC